MPKLSPMSGYQEGSNLLADPGNPFAVYFPVDSCSSSPNDVAFDDESTSQQSLNSLEGSDLGPDTMEPDPSMLTFVVNLRQVIFVNW